MQIKHLVHKELMDETDGTKQGLLRYTLGSLFKKEKIIKLLIRELYDKVLDRVLHVTSLIRYQTSKVVEVENLLV